VLLLHHQYKKGCRLINFCNCIVYLAIIGLVSQLIGMFLPRKWFNYRAFPYRTYGWEKGGRVYDKLKIKKWKTKVPDMSRLVKSMAPKQMQGRVTAPQMERMLAETCVAEAVHFALALCGFGCVAIWQGVGGVAVALVYALGNVPFILIQRYNRPRQAALYAAIRMRTHGGNNEPAK